MLEQNNISSLAISLFISGILICGYLVCMSYFDFRLFSFANLAQFLVSVLMMILALTKIQSSGLRIYSIFLLVHALFLGFNAYNLSTLQYIREFRHLYFIIPGIIILAACFYLGEIKFCANRIILPKRPMISSGVLVNMILCVYMAGYLVLFTLKGSPFLSVIFSKSQYGIYHAYSATGLGYYRIPILSGLLMMMNWFLLMLIPTVKRPQKIMIIAATLLFSGVLMLSRGNIIRIMLFFILFGIYQQKNKIFSTKNVAIFILSIIIIISSFTMLGEYRHHSSNMNKFNFSSVVQSHIDNKAVSWLYAYTSMSYDVLLQYQDYPIKNLPLSILQPILRLVGQQEIYENIYIECLNVRLKNSGLNAATIFSGFVHDFGILYILEIVVFGLVIAGIVKLIILVQAQGAYIFILMLVAISIMGNYFSTPSFLFPVLAIIILTPFIRNSNEKT